ncbi:B-4DMT family transporter [Amycolatopsis sp. GM8]|uniref:B-4DMT family transporter n=1 Tax=Amycolatopsis sp. GM8 TaxID=2896530 RepID=UPI001F3E18E1|nr:B-4DMT family transporter [Amycolatopsis sp. GM8]
MRPWLTRGLVMAVLHGAADTALAKATVFDPTGLLTAKIATIALLVGAAALWGAVDAWLRREDAGRTWVIAALFAGLGSGVLYVIGRGIFVDQAGTSELGPALTGGAAFAALLVLVPAGLGLFVGARLGTPAPAKEKPSPRPRRRVPSPAPRAK